MKSLVRLASQVRYVNKAFWRNPAAAFFTFAFPLMFLVIFTSLLGHPTLHIGGRTIHYSTYYVAAMAAYAVIGACYSNIATSVTAQRDAGILKRTNGTPLPSGVYLGARVIHAMIIAVLLVVITAAFGIAGVIAKASAEKLAEPTARATRNRTSVMPVGMSAE